VARFAGPQAHGRLLFQLRDNIPDVSDPGKLDFFGGGREGDESFLECVVREVHEEICFHLAPEQDVGPDHWVPECTLHSEIFLAREVPIDRLTVTEGTLKIVAFDELEQMQDLLAPSAKRALEIFRLTRPASVAGDLRDSGAVAALVRRAAAKMSQ
jgi:8-oxo-dGTP diphosphatase